MILTRLDQGDVLFTTVQQYCYVLSILHGIMYGIKKGLVKMDAPVASVISANTQQQLDNMYSDPVVHLPAAFRYCLHSHDGA